MYIDEARTVLFDDLFFIFLFTLLAFIWSSSEQNVIRAKKMERQKPEQFRSFSITLKLTHTNWVQLILLLLPLDFSLRHNLFTHNKRTYTVESCMQFRWFTLIYSCIALKTMYTYTIFGMNYWSLSEMPTRIKDKICWFITIFECHFIYSLIEKGNQNSFTRNHVCMHVFVIVIIIINGCVRTA